MVGIETYQRLFDKANVPIIIINEEFIITDANAMASKLLDMPRADIIGENPTSSKISPEFQENGISSEELGPLKFSQVVQGKELRFEWTHKRRNGEQIPIEVSLFGFEVDGKQNYFAVWNDLSEVKEKDKKIKEREELFQSVFLQSSDGIILLGKDRLIYDCNDAAVRMFKFKSRKLFKNKSPLDYSPKTQPNGESSKSIANSHIVECLEKGKSQFEWKHFNQEEEEFWVDIVMTRITINEELYIHCLLRDITTRKSIENELRKYQNDLEELVSERTKNMNDALNRLKDAQNSLIQAEKMASLGILTSGISHEINNPLNYILNSYTALRDQVSTLKIEDKTIGVLLDTLKVGVDRLNKIIKTLNAFSKVNDAKDETCDMVFIVDNCLLLIQHLVVNKIDVVKSYSKDTLPVIGNNGMLHQAILNVLTNATQSIEKKGVIQIRAEEKDGVLFLSIEDDGKGIRKEIQDKVFDPFFTTRNPGEGAGLGLSMTYKIIKDHKGSIELDSKAGKGTKIKISLPLSH